MSHRTSLLAVLLITTPGCSSGTDGGGESQASTGGERSASGGSAGSAGGDARATSGARATGSGGNAGIASGGTRATGSGGSSGGGQSAGGALQGGGGKSAGGASQGGGGKSAGGASPGGGQNAGGTSQGSGGATAGGSAGAAGNAGAAATCKRGVAANTAPGAAFSPSVGWWYNWSSKASGADVGVEFVPMIWGKSTLNAAIPAGSRYLLTFNEPNFHAQSNLTPQQAADAWPTIEASAKAAHVPIVSPAMNFCGPADQCNGTSPYQYLKDFFAACTNCEVDYVAVHWYNCDLPSLKDYLEPGGSLEGFEQFGKPIWLTEFSCNGSASAADQEKFMRAAVPYLEGNSHVYRYSWFSAGPIPNAELINDDGTPTSLGKVYIGLDDGCH